MVYGRVYSIRSHQTTDIYIGSTTQILCKRMTDHRSGYRLYIKNNNHYLTSFEILKYEDAYIELIHEGDFESKEKLRECEGMHIREMKCVNKQIPGRTEKEWRENNKEILSEKAKQYNEKNQDYIIKYQQKYREEHKDEKIDYNQQYYIDNKEHVLEQSNEYYRNNKEHVLERVKNNYETNKVLISEKRKQKYECVCGSRCNVGDKAKHEKTKKHKLFLQNKI